MPIHICLIIYIAMSAAEDIKDRTISLRLSRLFAAIGAALSLIDGREPVSILQALSIAAAILLGALLTKGAVGIGDAVLVGTCAMYLGADELLLCVAAAWIMCAFTALFIIAAGTAAGRRMSAGSRGLPFATYMLPPILLIALPKLIAA